ncbi:hypothetical protein EMIHUDRAFT_219147 [Emiliania huxleyi CCMP1516]|uniref:Ankyrin repeat protein n=2 Tax=Emiliania huxleyi TaxID=2903 RepID=A0A0D3I5S5_EMIH1|nr:hypothetical protein EMIHUDRAFT_219147 [Emiliania huxleyi CCMP1516]EOD06610.1 hypothetical protein EMIHUDRAFT_219147 [Emiliania huxleyi CCMP1516]|eukprot:XP_005759039.1 hypothetical protein EMIHUDRAFT_219147 [Emiliania huxleyi CCMP1516]
MTADNNTAEDTADAVLDAAMRGDAEALAALLAGGADPNARDGRHAMPALHWACASDEAKCVDALLCDGRTDVSAKSAHGMSALHVAASSNALTSLLRLLAAGLSVDQRNEWEETPLHVAVAGDSSSCVAALLSAGASAFAVDRWGRSASAVAEQQGSNPARFGLPDAESLPKRATRSVEGAAAAVEPDHAAFASMRVALANDLAEAIADRRATAGRRPALSKLVEWPGDEAEVARLLACGSVEPAGRDAFGLSAHHKFCSVAATSLAALRVRALRLLIERCGESRLRLEATARDSAGRTALEIAIERGHGAAAALLQKLQDREEAWGLTPRAHGCAQAVR